MYLVTSNDISVKDCLRVVITINAQQGVGDNRLANVTLFTRFLEAINQQAAQSEEPEIVREGRWQDLRLVIALNTHRANEQALADIERGFKVLKSEIEIEQVHHRLLDRIRAHAMICFIALVIQQVMRVRLKATPLTMSSHQRELAGVCAGFRHIGRY